MACKYAIWGVSCFVVALPIGLVVGEVLAQQYQLSMEVKRAELERLQAESAAPTDRASAGAEENDRSIVVTDTANRDSRSAAPRRHGG